MKNSFVNRVSAERAILRVVNGHYGRARQLSGLSWVAIENWRDNVNLPASCELVNELKALSDECQRLSDRSHETFSELDDEINGRIMKRLELLETAIQDY